MKVRFAISSHNSFYKGTYPIITNSLLNSGVPADDIFFFIGGNAKYKKIDNQINLYEVDHNSIDFTGLISVLDLKLSSDYWFLIHDTCYVGENFYKKIQDFTYNTDVIKLSSGISMNMGCYHQNYLTSIKKELISYKNQNLDFDSLQTLKCKLIQNEDCFLNIPNHSYFSANNSVEGPIDFYNNGILRIIEHYNDIDLHKLKSNWVGKDIYELNL